MVNVTAIIPVLLGSTRIPDKNLILVNGKVLCSYSIESCLQSGAFSNVYLNSENRIFNHIAKKTGIKFHLRPPDFGGQTCTQVTKSRSCNGNRCVTNEHYLYEFMTTETCCDYVCQINSTSPLLKPETIKQFVDTMINNEYDSLFATNEVRAESFYNKKPISFSKKFKQPSDELKPIQVVCWAIAGWRRQSFINAYLRDDINEDGPVFVGKQGIFPIDEREALDIDEWSTLEVVEQFLKNRSSYEHHEWSYIDGRTIIEN